MPKVTLPDGTDLDFQTEDAWDKFIDRERSYWAKYSGKDYQGVLSNKARNFYNTVAQLSARNHTKKENVDLSYLVMRYQNGLEDGTIIFSGSLRAKYLDVVEHAFGPEVRRATMSYWLIKGLERLDNATKFDFEGMFCAQRFELERAGGSYNHHEKYEKARELYEAQRTRLAASLNDREASFARLDRLVPKFIERTRRYADKSRATFLNESDKLIQDRVSRLSDLENEYREKIKLKAPVTYWNDKAARHRRGTIIWGVASLGYALLVGLALREFAGFLFEETIGAIGSPDLMEARARYRFEDLPTALTFASSAIFVFVSTILIWIGRILVRLFLSEHHLMVDSRQRSAMTETYLALIGEGGASEEDRTIILSALFRPAADGLVKDDGAPTLSPASLISRGQ